MNQLKVVIDTNVLVSALLRRTSIPHQIHQAYRDGKFIVIISPEILKEIGGYDYGYIGTSEWCEVDVAFRIRKKGYRLFFDKNIAVEHRVSRSGVFHRRHAGRERLNNFARFYISSYFPKSVKGWALFSLYFLAFSFYTVILSFNRGKKHTDEE